MKAALVILIVAISVSGVAAYGHHSFSATYEETKSIKIEGKIVQFLFRNPHSFVHVMAPDETGALTRWSVEWGGAGQLGAQGVEKDSFKPGDVVVITGNPGRDASEHRMRMVTLKRTKDGFGWGTQPGEVVK